MRVIFVEGTKNYHQTHVGLLWYVLWFLAVVLFVLFVVEPGWFVIPPFVHSVKVTL